MTTSPTARPSMCRSRHLRPRNVATLSTGRSWSWHWPGVPKRWLLAIPTSWRSQTHWLCPSSLRSSSGGGCWRGKEWTSDVLGVCRQLEQTFIGHRTLHFQRRLFSLVFHALSFPADVEFAQCGKAPRGSTGDRAGPTANPRGEVREPLARRVQIGDTARHLRGHPGRLRIEHPALGISSPAVSRVAAGATRHPRYTDHSFVTCGSQPVHSLSHGRAIQVEIPLVPSTVRQ